MTNTCPRCAGTLTPSRDPDTGEEAYCVQCGYIKQDEHLAVRVAGAVVDMNKGTRQRPRGPSHGRVAL